MFGKKKGDKQLPWDPTFLQCKQAPTNRFLLYFSLLRRFLYTVHTVVAPGGEQFKKKKMENTD